MAMIDNDNDDDDDNDNDDDRCTAVVVCPFHLRVACIFAFRGNNPLFQHL